MIDKITNVLFVVAILLIFVLKFMGIIKISWLLILSPLLLILLGFIIFTILLFRKGKRKKVKKNE